ncbi:MAG: DUF308 domain-containing protein [Lachnospiraceae bacterium]|nr:DUF308 domain-containing protein [Lachnospiraceae bacterium]
MADFFKGLKANYTISAVVCALLGLVLVIWPGATSQIICMLLGGVLLAYGVLQIAIYLFNRERTIILQGMMILGIVFAVLGLWILLKPEMIMMAVPVIVGVLIAIHGLHNVVQAFALKKDGYESWWLAFLLGLLTLIFGGVLICYPFEAIELVARIIGIFLIYDGVSDIWILSRVFKVRRDKERIIDAKFVDIEDED